MEVEAHHLCCVGVVAKEIEEIFAVDLDAYKRFVGDGSCAVDESAVGGRCLEGVAQQFLAMEVGHAVALVAFNHGRRRAGNRAQSNVLSRSCAFEARVAKKRSNSEQQHPSRAYPKHALETQPQKMGRCSICDR